jgi:hypothetical protein
MPDGLERSLFSELSGYADSTAPLCDELLKKPCYDELDPSVDPAPKLPKVPGAERFRGNPLVRHFEARCNRVDPEPGSTLWCNSAELTRSPSYRDERPECRLTTPSGWRDRELDSQGRDTPGDFLGVANQATCTYPWMNMVLVRKTGGNNRLVVHVSLFPSSYLHAHPDLATVAASVRPP